MAVEKGKEGSAVVRSFWNTTTTRCFHPANVSIRSIPRCRPQTQLR